MMEYCGKIGVDKIAKRALIKTLGAAIAIIFAVGSVCDSPSLDYSELGMNEEVYYGNLRGRGHQSGEKPFDAMKAGEILKKGASGLGIPRKSLADSVREAAKKDQRNAIEILSAGRNSDWADKMFVWNEGAAENAAIDWLGYDSNAIGLPEMDAPAGDAGGHLPVGDMIPNPPPHNPLSDISGQDAIPKPPNEGIVTTPSEGDGAIIPPMENIIPDIPQAGLPEVPADVFIPNTPIEGSTGTGDGEAADTPSDGSGTETIPVSGFQINADGMIYDVIFEDGLVDSAGGLALPSEGCAGILKGAFDGLDAGICEITIPSNITYIENGTFADLPELGWIDIEAGNPCYIGVDGVLFDGTQSTILAFPAGRVGTYNVPDYVTGFADFSFVNVKVEKLDMRACGLVDVGYSAFGEADGSNLVISAPKAYFTEYQDIFASIGIIVE